MEKKNSRELLTLKYVAKECVFESVKNPSLIWALLCPAGIFLFILLAGELTTLEKLGFGGGIAALLLLILWYFKRLEWEILSGRFYFIRCPLNEKHVETYADVDVSDTPYFYFNVGPDGSRYRWAYPPRFDDAEVGETYYLVLKKGRKGKPSRDVLYACPAAQHMLDDRLEQMLCRDIHLTGEQITEKDLEQRESRSRGEVLYREILARRAKAKEEVVHLTPEEREGEKTQYQRLVKWGTFLKGWVTVAPIVFALLAFISMVYLDFYPAEWWVRLVCCLVIVLFCHGPRFFTPRIEKKIEDLSWRVEAAGGKNLPEVPELPCGCLLFALSLMAHLFNGIWALAFLGILN